MSRFIKLKRYLSYLYDVRLESTSSDHNEELHVILSRGRHQLCTANAIYSYDDLYDNYRRAFDLIKIHHRRIDRVLILGLGLGSVPFMLEKRFQCDAHYTAVEIDEEVVRLANKYSLAGLKSPVETVIADAHSYILQNNEEYDLVCMDVFVDDIVPSKFQTEQFLQSLKSSLGEEGILLFNRLYRTKKDRKATNEFFQGPFKKVFSEGAHLDVRGNWMLTNRSLQGT